MIFLTSEFTAIGSLVAGNSYSINGVAVMIAIAGVTMAYTSK